VLWDLYYTVNEDQNLHKHDTMLTDNYPSWSLLKIESSVYSDMSVTNSHHHGITNWKAVILNNTHCVYSVDIWFYVRFTERSFVSTQTNVATISQRGPLIKCVIISPPYFSLWPLQTGVESVSLKPKEIPINQGKCTAWTKRIFFQEQCIVLSYAYRPESLIFSEIKICVQNSTCPNEIVRAMTDRDSLKALGGNCKILILRYC